MIKSAALFVTEDGPADDDHEEGQKRVDVREDVPEGAAFQIDHPHDLGEIGEGVEEGYGPRPLGHTADGGEDTAHQDEDDDDEEYHEHRLLHRAGVVGVNIACCIVLE